MTTTQITPYTIHIDQAALDDLQRRLASTRFPAPAPDDSWDYGTPVSYLQRMVEAWQQFDWRAQEARMNAVPNFVTEIDGQPIHFVHVRSAEAAGDAAAAAAHLPRLVRRVPRRDRAADRPGGPRRPGRGRVPRRDPVDARLRVQHAAGRGRLDDGPGRADVRHPDAGARLRVLRHPRQRRRRDDLPRARRARPARVPRRARAAALLVPVRAPRASSTASARRSTPRWSSSAGSSRSAATTR